MVDSNCKNRKEFITEREIATLLQRYDATTMLKLLQEIAYYAEPKMDWDELVSKSTTGITNAKEYQLLWRHLAYRDSLPPSEDDAQPMDDGSDLECELEASPVVSLEASVEAIAHVKVMAASYVPSESDLLDDSTLEAPLTINIPYGLHGSAEEPSGSPWSSRGMNIAFPVCLQKVPSTERFGNSSASGSMAFRRKRKKWSAEEDEELIAAVKRCGEGNWAHIVKGDFRGERTASQLSQRWALIRKRCDTSTPVGQSGLQRTEAQMAANHALSLALGSRPPSKKLAVGILPRISSRSITEAQTNGASSSQGQQQSRQVVQALPRTGASLPASESRAFVTETTVGSTSRLDLMVTANSVTAATCMAGPSTAASVLKAEPRKSAAGLVPKTEPVKNVSTASMPRPSGGLTVPKVEPVMSVAASNSIEAAGSANKRPVANGNLKAVTASPPSNKPLLMAPYSKGSTMVSASTPFASTSRMASNQRIFAASVPTTVLPPKQNAGKAAETDPCKSDGGRNLQTQGNRTSSLVAIQPNKMTSTNLEMSRGRQAAQAQSPNLVPMKNTVVQSGIHSATDQNLLERPSDKENKTAVTSISGADPQSKDKGEVNNKVGKVIRVSNVCSKTP